MYNGFFLSLKALYLKNMFYLIISLSDLTRLANMTFIIIFYGFAINLLQTGFYVVCLPPIIIYI